MGWLNLASTVLWLILFVLVVKDAGSFLCLFVGHKMTPDTRTHNSEGQEQLLLYCVRCCKHQSFIFAKPKQEGRDGD